MPLHHREVSVVGLIAKPLYQSEVSAVCPITKPLRHREASKCGPPAKPATRNGIARKTPRPAWAMPARPAS